MAKKVSHNGGGRKGLRVLDDERVFVGVDVHKKTYSVSVWTEGREEVARWVQPADPMALAARLEPVRAQLALVVYEAGPTGFTLARVLEEARLAVAVVAPSKIPVVRGPSSKCDRLDACRLAELASKKMLKVVYVPTLQEEADRQVVRRRHQAAKERRRAKHRVNSFLLQHQLHVASEAGRWSRAGLEALRELDMCPELRWTLDALLADYDHFACQLGAGNAALRELMVTERHAIVAALLNYVPGVGPVTIMTFLTEVPCPSRFSRGEEVTSFIGLAPRVRRSGGTTRGGPIVKCGNTALRGVLVEAAWCWTRCDPAAKKIYRRLVANTASTQKAIVGVARHLALLLWRIVTTGEVYIPGTTELETEDTGPSTES